MANNNREERGKAIAETANQVKRTDENEYEVLSQSNYGIYEVLKTSVGWICSCPHHIYRGAKCKHIFAVEFSSRIRKEVRIRRIEPETDIQACRFCGSNQIVHAGMRHNKNGDVSDTWRADELYVKIKGDMKYLFAIMDDETRFWIAQEIADSKYTHDARTLFQAGVKVAGKKPMTLITDGLAAYHEVYKKEFWTLKGPRTEHIQHITIRGDRNNNKMERMNGEVRDREKTMRGLKTKETAILPGYQLYHNYFRPHEALNGKTPAEACGIKIEGKNKWLTLTQNASKPSHLVL
jgi:transposase-like protein